VNQLTHESCFVNVNGFDEQDHSTMSKVWDMFNQKRKSGGDHFLEIKTPEEGTIMARIAKRLSAAAEDQAVLDRLFLEENYEQDLNYLEDQVDQALAREAEERSQKENERSQKEKALAREAEERSQKEKALAREAVMLRNSVINLHKYGATIDENATLNNISTDKVLEILGS
jgi:hypothetical protein